MTLEGDWSLSISPVKLEDEAEYQCQVGGAGDPSDAIRSVSASNFHSTNLLICQGKYFLSTSPSVILITINCVVTALKVSVCLEDFFWK